MLQGDAPITSWNGVGQVCAGRALATRQQGTCPAGRNINTRRNPGTLYGAFVTRRALCTCCLISSSQQPHEAILCWRPISQVRRLRKEWLRSLLRVTEPVLSPGSNPRPCPFTSLTDSVYHANNPEASVNNLGISPGLCETLMLLLAVCPHPLLPLPPDVTVYARGSHLLPCVWVGTELVREWPCPVL